jgi:hypothetical protein
VAEDVAFFHSRHEIAVEVQVRAADRRRGNFDYRVGRRFDLGLRDLVDADIPLAVPAECFHCGCGIR